MTHDEALSAAVEGCRVRPPHWQPGLYVEHSFSRGFLKCWPVDKPEDEPTRSSCDYRSTPEDEAAAWEALPDPRPALAIDASPVDAWGRSTPAAIVASWGPPDTLKIGGEVVGKITSFTMAQKVAKNSEFGKLGKPEPVAFCGECDFVKTACVCPKPDANKWGQPNKWGPGK